MSHIKFHTKEIRGTRKHYLDATDVQVLLSRLPCAVWSRLEDVYFCDRAWGNRILGYVTRGRRSISICALPAPVSLGRLMVYRSLSALEFGAPPRGRWPEEAIRRCLLYDTFLHEIGHLQVVRPRAKGDERRFAGETLAQQFADYWRRRLWRERFDHPDPIHNPPNKDA